MSQHIPTTLRHVQTRAEEMANTLSHGLALLYALVGMPFLVVDAVATGTASTVIGVSIFGACMITLYLASTIYHALPAGRAKNFFQVVDHAAIYLLIAGTYTPFTLGVLNGAWGWSLLGIVWMIALVGIAFKTRIGASNHHFSTLTYLLMGWMVVVAIVPLSQNMEPAGLAWLVAGGLAYSGGVAFYVAKRLRYSHFIWHLFVMTGTACHFVAVLRYSA